MEIVTDLSILEPLIRGIFKRLIRRAVIKRKRSWKKPNEGNVSATFLLLKNGNLYFHCSFAGKHEAGDPTQDSERIVLRKVISLVLREKELMKERKLDQSFFDRQLRKCAHRIQAIYLFTERKPCGTEHGCWNLLEAIGRKVPLYVSYDPNFPKKFRK